MRKILDKLVQQSETGFLADQLKKMSDLTDCPPDALPLNDGHRRRQFLERQKLNAPGGIRDQAVAAGLLTAEDGRRLSFVLTHWNGQSSLARHSAHRIINYLFHVRRYIGFKLPAVGQAAPQGSTVTPGWFGDQPASVLPRSAWTLRDGGPGWGRS